VVGPVVGAAAVVVDPIVGATAMITAEHLVMLVALVADRIVASLTRLRHRGNRNRAGGGEGNEDLGVARGHGVLPFSWVDHDPMLRLGRS
jgi:hypothetical protein